MPIIAGSWDEPLPQLASRLAKIAEAAAKSANAVSTHHQSSFDRELLTAKSSGAAWAFANAAHGFAELVKASDFTEQPGLARMAFEQVLIATDHSVDSYLEANFPDGVNGSELSRILLPPENQSAPVKDEREHDENPTAASSELLPKAGRLGYVKIEDKKELPPKKDPEVHVKKKRHRKRSAAPSPNAHRKR